MQTAEGEGLDTNIIFNFLKTEKITRSPQIYILQYSKYVHHGVRISIFGSNPRY